MARGISQRIRSVRVPWPLVSIGLALVVVVLTVLLVSSQSGPSVQKGQESPEVAWENANREQIIALKAEADRLALDQRLREAHGKYAQIQKLVAGRLITNPYLADSIDHARVAQERVFRLLMDQFEERYYAAIEAATRAAAQRADLPREQYPPGYVQVAATRPRENPPDPPATRIVYPFVPQDFAATKPATQTSPTTAVTRPVLSDPPIVQSTGSQHPGRRLPGGIEVSRRELKPLAVSDEQLEDAIRRGVTFLLSQFERGQLRGYMDKAPAYREGLHALCVLALLHAKDAIRDDRLSLQRPQMQGLLDALKRHFMSSDAADLGDPVTYARSLRAAALAMANRPEDRAVLAEDARWLLGASVEGAFTYSDVLARLGPAGLKLDGANPFLETDDRDGRGRIFFHNGERRVPIRIRPPRLKPLPQHMRVTVPRMPVGPGLIQPPTIPEEVPAEINFPWDNSNSQYALYGLYMAASAGIEVPEKFWGEADEHWRACQLRDGRWAYKEVDRTGTHAMTVGGIASLLITQERFDLTTPMLKLGQNPFSVELEDALKWMDTGDNAIDIVGGGKTVYYGYNLFGLSRAAGHCGFKYFGKHDWFAHLCAKTLPLQNQNGSWGRRESGADAIIDTAYVVMFLSRGRHPVMMNKLGFEGSWANYPRDLLYLSRFASRELERALNWQVVPVTRDWSDWTDSPVLYLGSHVPPKLADEELRKLRDFALGGGVIFTQADNASANMTRWVEQTAAKLFPEHRMADLPADHPVYSTVFRMTSKPPLKAVSNGARLLWVHSSGDLAMAWHMRAEKTRRASFELGTNLFAYVAGKTDLRYRLKPFYLPQRDDPPIHTVQVARVRYNGTWDPEPYAWEQMSRRMGWNTNWRIQTVVADAADLQAQKVPMAHLTGTAAAALDPKQIASIRHYVQNGGVLLIDATGGGPFAESMERTLLAGLKLPPAAEGHPLLKGELEGMADVSAVRVRPLVPDAKALRPRLQKLGRGWIVYSPLDITTGMLGATTHNLLGYDPDWAQQLVQNLVLWTADGARE